MKHINIYYGYITRPTIDANLHPDVQIEKLHKLISESKTDVINIRCNSPYILNEITLIQGYYYNKVPHPKGFKILANHFNCLKDGSKESGILYQGMISDENMLNDKLGESNDKYSEMLDLKKDHENS